MEPEYYKPLRLGVDLGGTKIEAAVLDGGHRVLARERIATPQGGYSAVVEAIARLCNKLEATLGLSDRLPLGIGTPGSPSPDSGLMRNCNSVCLNGHSLAEDLEACCARPVRLANDADCFALSEAVDGAGIGTSPLFGVILGTGVGGGICVDGKLLSGPNAIAGEWGHNPLALDRTQTPQQLRDVPRSCYCGRQNCIETWLSGPGLALTHQQLHGRELSESELHHQPLAADVRQTLEVYVDQLAVALAGVVNVLDPQTVVLGGGLSNLGYIYEALPDKLARQLFSDVSRTSLRRPHHGDSSGVRGAAWLWN